MAQKKFQLAADQIKPVAMGYGSCLATDRITVDGSTVGYCYREDPDTPEDSGWRFFAGDESQEYTDDPDNLALYDVNTIANYDPDIAGLLEAPVGSTFERDGSGQFVPVAVGEA
ncbi:MAG: DUF2185 domain-containing protein [Lysobacter sp.]